MQLQGIGGADCVYHVSVHETYRRQVQPAIVHDLLHPCIAQVKAEGAEGGLREVTLVGYAEVVAGEDRGIGQITQLAVGGHQGRVPIVEVDYFRVPVEGLDGGQNGAREKCQAVHVVRISAPRWPIYALTIEVVMVLDHVDRYSAIRQMGHVHGTSGSISGHVHRH